MQTVQICHPNRSGQAGEQSVQLSELPSEVLSCLWAPLGRRALWEGMWTVGWRAEEGTARTRNVKIRIFLNLENRLAHKRGFWRKNRNIYFSETGIEQSGSGDRPPDGYGEGSPTFFRGWASRRRGKNRGAGIEATGRGRGRIPPTFRGWIFWVFWHFFPFRKFSGKIDSTKPW